MPSHVRLPRPRSPSRARRSAHRRLCLCARPLPDAAYIEIVVTLIVVFFLRKLGVLRLVMVAAGATAAPAADEASPGAETVDRSDQKASAKVHPASSVRYQCDVSDITDNIQP